MALLTFSRLDLAYGHRPLLEGAAFALEPGERVALIGRNATGKSSLLKIIAGLEQPDGGDIQMQQALVRVYVAQEPAFPPGCTVFEAVRLGLGRLEGLLREHEALMEAQPGSGQRDAASMLIDLQRIHGEIELLDGWGWEARVQEALQRLNLDPQSPVDRLSGGVRKRVALAQALVARPDLLLLDEPTNHLDLQAIEWLSGLLAAWRGALILVSHDRAFIDAVATRIVELDRGQLHSYPGNYSAFERIRADQWQAQDLAHARADKLLAQEEAWIRKGVEARRTRSASRVARLEALRHQRVQRRERLGQVRMELDAGKPSGRIVAELEDVGLRHAPHLPWLVRRFTATILRGDKVGVIGPNGVGKTSLLRLILGQLEPTEGRIRRGTQLQIAYFDQMRAGLDLDATLAQTISPGSEWIEVGGSRRHVMSYLTDFLFAPERAGSPVRTLSGGERNRLLLARLFALPANVLVLDEPTNDLDIDTLELLEELLQAYPGTVFLVSHDRRFVDSVVTSTIAWEGDAAGGSQDGLWRESEGGIEDWLAQRQRARAIEAASPRQGSAAPASAPQRLPATPVPAPQPRRKLTYKEQRELQALPLLIEQLEAEQRQIQLALADGSLYANEHQRAAELSRRNEAIETELMQALQRWEALDSR